MLPKSFLSSAQRFAISISSNRPSIALLSYSASGNATGRAGPDPSALDRFPAASVRSDFHLHVFCFQQFRVGERGELPATGHVQLERCFQRGIVETGKRSSGERRREVGDGQPPAQNTAITTRYDQGRFYGGGCGGVTPPERRHQI